MFDMCVWWRVRVRERGGQDSCCGMQGLENVVLDAFCVCVCVCVCVCRRNMQAHPQECVHVFLPVQLWVGSVCAVLSAWGCSKRATRACTLEYTRTHTHLGMQAHRGPRALLIHTLCRS